MGGKYLKFLEKSHTAVIYCFLIICAGLCAAQQPAAKTPSAPAIGKARLSNLTQSAPAPSFKPNPLIARLGAKLATDHRSLNTAPPADLAGMLSSANLPAASARHYSMPALAKASFLTPGKEPSWTSRDFRIPAGKGLNLLNSPHPAPGDFQK
jgi:hypothetical protein